MATRVGIVGYGSLGAFLVEKILVSSQFQLAFVWNRTPIDPAAGLDEKYVLRDLAEFADRKAQLIVEVAHPCISERWAELFLQHAHYLIGSPTALAAPHVYERLAEAASVHSLLVPAGAFWGGEDIRKMAENGSLKAVEVTMRKHPSSFKLTEAGLCRMNASVTDEPVTLYEGSVRALCPLAPNNVNTMAAAAVAATNLGFDGVRARLVSDPRLREWHVIEIYVEAHPETPGGPTFSTRTERRNPANPGAVTGSATYHSFFASMKGFHGKGPGIHLC